MNPGFARIVGRPLLHKPSTCPQSTENRSPCRGGMPQYNYMIFQKYWLLAKSNRFAIPVTESHNTQPDDYDEFWNIDSYLVT